MLKWLDEYKDQLLIDFILDHQDDYVDWKFDYCKFTAKNMHQEMEQFTEHKSIEWLEFISEEYDNYLEDKKYRGLDVENQDENKDQNLY